LSSEWGFILAGRQAMAIAQKLVEIPNATVHWPKTRFLTAETLPDLFRFPADMARVPTEVNQLNNPSKNRSWRPFMLRYALLCKATQHERAFPDR
jgi:predicted membrane-bound spermidine synthase